MDTKTAIDISSGHLRNMIGKTFDIFTLAKPSTIDEAVDMAKMFKIVSKLSPLVGNLIEHDTIEFLNQLQEFGQIGEWKRQDPGFPDVVFDGEITPSPGYEIKAWYPFSTEITGRFKDSQRHFEHDQTYVLLFAWLPEHLIYGKPQIIDMLITSGQTVAKARDDHYHNPPDYLVLEPEDTSSRTQNLQQTNTNGLKLQLTENEEGKYQEAQEIVEGWGNGGKEYKTTPEYQAQIKGLRQQFNYRLDTNYAKIDRIAHTDIEEFKSRVLGKVVHGLAVSEWFKILKDKDEESQESIASALRGNIADLEEI